MKRVDTALPADSVEFCPSLTSTEIFVCGTYQLEEKKTALNGISNDGVSSNSYPRRWGKCLVFEVDPDKDECNELQAIEMSAVLDMKWSSTLLAISDAEGHIILHRWQYENRTLEHIQTVDCSPEALICLSLDWAHHRLEHHADKMSVSLSNGSVTIARQLHTGMCITDTWHAHDFEPWITAWDRWNTNVVYTGGDDCRLKGWDLRVGFNMPIFTNKSFDGGVTAIQSNPHLENALAVGSYDSAVRLFDMRQPQQAVTQEIVGGGAWRVKWHPEATRKHHLLVACMHDNFKVVDFEAEPEVAHCRRIFKRFDRHESLAYGVDWSYASANKDGSLVASCSFYDRSLYLWRA